MPPPAPAPKRSLPSNEEALVWATMKGYPPWPAIARPVNNGEFDCTFFRWHGSHAVLPSTACVTFEQRLDLCEPSAVKKIKKQSLRAPFRAAVADALEWIEEAQKRAPRRSGRAREQRDLEAEAAFLSEPSSASTARAEKKRTAPHGEAATRSKPKRESIPELPPLRNTDAHETPTHGFVECKGLLGQGLCEALAEMDMGGAEGISNAFQKEVSTGGGRWGGEGDGVGRVMGWGG